MSSVYPALLTNNTRRYYIYLIALQSTFVRVRAFRNTLLGNMEYCRSVITVAVVIIGLKNSLASKNNTNSVIP